MAQDETISVITKARKNPYELLESVQESLIRRFTKNIYNKPIVFEFTEDPALLHQYYRLRDQVFGRDVGCQEEGGVGLHDKISEILVVRRGNMVIGGCRLTVRECDESFFLPMESEQFQLRKIFPELPLNKVRHGVISKLVILEEKNRCDILHGFCQIMYDKVIASNIQYLFVRALNYTFARNWRLIANSFGAKHTRICENIDVPEDPNLPGEKAYITFSDLSELCANHIQSPIPYPRTRTLELVVKN